MAYVDGIAVDDGAGTVDVQFTPTIPHCSMATLIGLSIRVKLLRSLPSRFRVSVRITPGTHASEEAVNKQLADKERVAAALENSHLLDVVNKCIARTDRVEDLASAHGSWEAQRDLLSAVDRLGRALARDPQSPAAAAAAELASLLGAGSGVGSVSSTASALQAVTTA